MIISRKDAKTQSDLCISMLLQKTDNTQIIVFFLINSSHKELDNMTENEIANKVYDCAFRVHQALGPGLLESAYEECLFYEMKNSGLNVEKQKNRYLYFIKK